MSPEFERILEIVIVAVAVVWVIQMLVRIWLDTHSLKSVDQKINALRSDTGWMDTVEGNALKSTDLKPVLDIFRNIVLPAFYVGLQIVPQGDLKLVATDGLKLFDNLTDAKPNLPPDTTTTTTQTTTTAKG